MAAVISSSVASMPSALRDRSSTRPVLTLPGRLGLHILHHLLDRRPGGLQIGLEGLPPATFSERWKSSTMLLRLLASRPRRGGREWRCRPRPADGQRRGTAALSRVGLAALELAADLLAQLQQSGELADLRAHLSVRGEDLLLDLLDRRR